MQPTSQRYFETLFDNNKLVWKEIYLLPRLAIINTPMRNLQYKILNNVNKY